MSRLVGVVIGTPWDDVDAIAEFARLHGVGYIGLECNGSNVTAAEDSSKELPPTIFPSGFSFPPPNPLDTLSSTM
jgi:hypothetical protein